MDSPLRIPLPILVLACILPASAGKEKNAAQGVQDSLEVIITGEMEDRSKVIRLKDPRAADTLLTFRAPGDRQRFDRLIADDAVAEEVRTLEEFRAHWRKVEAESGLAEMRAQFAARDIDRSRIPRLYLFDSSVVVYPGWVIVRKKHAGKPANRTGKDARLRQGNGG